jgi:nitroimidazol reductase NimA-like FMN-containing flavoprotein (pyridoxamine 5'-phosphate oxidase superfamily)
MRRDPGPIRCGPVGVLSPRSAVHRSDSFFLRRSAEMFVRVFSTVGQKIDWMRQNPKVCVEIEDVADKNHWTTVLAFVRYEEMGDSPVDRAAHKAAEQLFSKRPEWWLPAAAKVGSHEHHAMVIYRIQIDRMTGRRASRDRAPA